MRMKDLSRFSIPDSLIGIWEKEMSETLLPIQEEAIKAGVLSGKNVVVIAPTTSGKTFIGELAVARMALKKMKAFYLVPFKAIAEEKGSDFSTKYGEYGIRTVLATGDHPESDPVLQDGSFDIAIATYEKCASVM